MIDKHLKKEKMKDINNHSTTVIVTYWNEDNDVIKEVEFISCWSPEAIMDDKNNWLDANNGLEELKEYGGEFDWFEITNIVE